MPIPGIVGLASSATSSVTSVASQAASPFAHLLGQAAQQSSPTLPASTFSTTAGASGAQQSAANALTAFNAQLQKLLSAEGVDTSQPIVLQSDGMGGVELANDHPDASKIRSILAENPSLAAQFASVQQAYLQAQAAGAAASSGSQAFSITISGQQAQASFS